MRHLIYLIAIGFLSLGCGTAAQQQYRTHKVEKGETAFSISKTYGINIDDLYRLNPTAKESVGVGTVLVLPTASTTIISNQQVQLKEHKVKRKETLFSISQEYNVAIEDIKKYNKQLYSAELQKGDKIIIPVSLKKSKDDIIKENENPLQQGTKRYSVAEKETKFGIARKFGISVADLEKLNPELSETLQVNQVIVVPEDQVVKESLVDEDKFEFYEVQPKEGFYRLKVKLGLTEEQIVDLNPYAKDGLKDGMVLKIPKIGKGVSSENIQNIDLSKNIVNKSKKNIALMLPFAAGRTADSDLIKSDPTLRVALDFYSGVLMAAEFAKDKGISVNIDVYDTEKSDSKTESIINGKDFKNVDAVIGPLLQKNVEIAASLLKNDDIPIFSPLSNREIKMSSNLFQTLPTQDLLTSTLISFLVKNQSSANIIIVADSKFSKEKDMLVAALPDAKVVSPRGNGYVNASDISANFVSGKNNWVVLESSSSSLVSSVVRSLTYSSAANKVRLFTSDKNDAYDFTDISNVHLGKLNLTYPSVNKSIDIDSREPFIVSYKNKYGVPPNRYAIRGFDITCDVIFRLASADDMYDATDGTKVTEYVENKFRYAKQPMSGYQNTAAYMIKINNDLTFEAVE